MRFEFSRVCVRVLYFPRPMLYCRSGHRSRNELKWPLTVTPVPNSVPLLCCRSAESLPLPIWAGQVCFIFPELLVVCGQCCGSSSDRIHQLSIEILRPKNDSLSRIPLDLQFLQLPLSNRTKNRTPKPLLLLGRIFSHRFRLFR